MRRILCILMVLMIGGAAGPVQAQETLYGIQRRHGGYGGVVVKRSTVAEAPAWLIGFQAGWVYNAASRHTLVLGLGAYGVTTDVDGPDGGRIGLDYGGVEMAYVYASRARLHPSVHLLVGAGNVAVTGAEDRSDDLIVLEPAADFEGRLLPFLRVAAGVGYRLVSGARVDGIRAGDLAGAEGVFVVKVGRF